jgi:hypothetical protein
LNFWLRQDKNGIVRIAKRVDVEEQLKLPKTTPKKTGLAPVFLSESATSFSCPV